MRILKLKAFARWARKEGLPDASLRAAVHETRRGLIGVDLGAGLFKKRVARPGEGKSGGYRTLIAADLRERWVFRYGFGKNERDDVDEDELRELKRLARCYLALSDDTIAMLLEELRIIEVRDGEPKTS